VNSTVVQLVMENGIDILFLPAHLSHKMQPLDTAVYAAFKQEVTNQVASNKGKGCV